MSRSCAICVEPIRGLVHMEMIDDRGPYALCSGCHTPTKAPRSAKPLRTVQSTGAKRGPRRRDELENEKSAYMRRLREQNVRDGLCRNARKHGPAVHGVFCLACHEKSLAWSTAYRKKRSTAATDSYISLSRAA